MRSLWFVFLILVCIGASGAEAFGSGMSWTEGLDVSGWADTVQSVRTREPHDSVTSRARLRLELSMYMDNLYGFVSADAEKNWNIESETGTDLQEAWLEYASDRWDLRLGRQIIIWGKADGIRITDNISPPDYTESVTRDLDEIRMAVDAAKFRLLGERISTEIIFIPVFRSSIQPEGDNPWAVTVDYPDYLSVSSSSAEKPATTIENSEVAMKVSGYFSGMDAAASVFYTWDDDAVMFRDVYETGDMTRVDFMPEYRRMTVLGLECARPWSSFVFRGEAAYFLGRYFSRDSMLEDPVKRDSLKWLGGVDWYPGNDWTVIGQITGSRIFGYDSSLASDRHSVTATLNISKKVFRQTVTLSNMVYYDITGDEYFDRVKMEWDVLDGVSLTGGADIFAGDDGSYGCYRDNSQLWIKAKYAF